MKASVQAVRPGEDKRGRGTNCKRHLFRTEQEEENLGKILILNGEGVREPARG